MNTTVSGMGTVTRRQTSTAHLLLLQQTTNNLVACPQTDLALPSPPPAHIVPGWWSRLRVAPQQPEPLGRGSSFPLLGMWQGWWQRAGRRLQSFGQVSAWLPAVKGRLAIGEVHKPSCDHSLFVRMNAFLFSFTEKLSKCMSSWHSEAWICCQRTADNGEFHMI